MPCLFVKLAVLLNLVVWTAFVEGVPYPKYECGLYRGNGQLKLTKHSHFIFALRAGTYSPMEFVVLGGGAKEKLGSLGKNIELEFYVPKPIHTPDKAFVFLRALSRKSSLKQNEVKLLKKEKCGLPLDLTKASRS